MTGKLLPAALALAAATGLAACGGAGGAADDVAIFDEVPAGAPVEGLDEVGPAPLAPSSLNTEAQVAAATPGEGRRAAVTVAGGADTPLAAVERQLLLGAARIAEARGAPYFALEGMRTGVDIEPAYAAPNAFGRNATVAEVEGPVPRSGWGASVVPIGPVGPFVAGAGVAPAAERVRAYEAVATVVPLEERPEGRPDVYATAAVLARYAPIDEAPGALE